MDNRLLMSSDEEDELYGKSTLYNRSVWPGKFALLSSSSSLSEDEDDEPMVACPKMIKLEDNPFVEYDDVEFVRQFRVSKQSANMILREIRGALQADTARNHPVSPEVQLLIALRFYGTGNFQLCIGDQFNVSNSTVCRIVQRVTKALGKHRPRFLNLPQNKNELLKITTGFYKIGKIPNVLGVIDCIHVKVHSPGGAEAEDYRNPNGWFSINVQAVCSFDLKFIDVVARWPGSVDNLTIFDDSLLRVKLENNKFPNCRLLGDAEYACKSYLLTPLQNPITPEEINFNTSHIKTRNTIERAFDILKRRFPCLSVGMRLKMETTVMVIVVTMILHNIAISNHDPEPDEDSNGELSVSDIVEEPDGQENKNNTIQT